jgi:hypothetical protein
VERIQGPYRLEFDDNAVVDNEIKTISAVDQKALVVQGYHALAVDAIPRSANSTTIHVSYVDSSRPGPISRWTVTAPL